MTLWKLKLIKPKEAIRKGVFAAWQETIPELEVWMRKVLVPAMVFGGLGIQGIAQTPFYRFITSVQGLSQLGIEKSEPPKLLKAYEKTFKVRKTKNTVSLKFGDTAQLKSATPHPAAGTGHLQVSSWLEWIVDDVVVGRGFVERSRVKNQNAIRLGAPLGGLMLPKGALGSTGLWRFPGTLKDYEDKWFRQNVKIIQRAIIERAVKIFTAKLVS